jgi:hypothetical protein
VENAIVRDLKAKTNEAWTGLTGQLEGMEPYLERSDAPGEWTTREVLSHLLFDEGWDPVATLKTFDERKLPLIEIVPGKTSMTEARKKMPLKQLVGGLDAQRAAIFGYLDTLSEAAVTQRKARIPLFTQIMGSEEIPINVYVGALFSYHWNDHAGQLAKIRKACGLAEAKRAA